MPAERPWPPRPKPRVTLEITTESEVRLEETRYLSRRDENRLFIQFIPEKLRDESILFFFFFF